MKNLKNILTILFFVLLVTSCGQTKTEKKSDDNKSQKLVEKKYSNVISDSTNILTDKVVDLEIEYTDWGCAYPNWIAIKDKYSNALHTNYLGLHFYIEPAEKTLELPIYFDALRHKLKITGQFYEREDYPKGTIELQEPMPKAKVFRYTRIEVIDMPNFKADTKIETLTLVYNAISCTCAQWSETRFKNSTNKGPHYWLEPANEKLIEADNLFDGNNIPIIIKVTGQVVTEKGFPKRELVKVSKEEAGKVFRYSKLEVLQIGEKKNVVNYY